jgi:hypothetical protein
MPTSPVMQLLARGVPVTLLLDLADPAGPDSRAILAAEPAPTDPIWLDAAVLERCRAATA